MAVDLFDLVETLRRAVNPPGTDNFPNADDDVFAGYLTDAFWELRMLDMFSDYTASDTVVIPVTGTTDLPREQQQLIVLFAAITIVTNELKNMDTTFRAKAGSVEFETGKSGPVLRDVLAELQRRRLIAETTLFAIGEVTDAYIDSVVERAGDTYAGTWWVR